MGRATVVSLDAERRRRDPSRKVGLWAEGGLVYIQFADGKTVWLTPEKALATLADTAEAEGPNG